MLIEPSDRTQIEQAIFAPQDSTFQFGAILFVCVRSDGHNKPRNEKSRALLDWASSLGTY